MKNDLYFRELTFENLLNIYKLVKKTCKNRNKIKNYDLNLYSNLYILLNKLKNFQYKPMPYTVFVISEPKKRIVMSQEINDKIVNHFVAKHYLIPILDKKLISQNVATRKDMGTRAISKLMFDYLNILNRKRKDIYALKLDIHKYFYTIDINILLDKLSNDIKDNNVVNLIRIILKEASSYYVTEKVNYLNKKYDLDIPLYTKNAGISIGAMTSQFLAIYYLNSLDHFIKEKLQCKYYLRYQDDLVLFSYDKNELKVWWGLINIEINKLNLKLNDKSNIYKLNNGFNFIGINYRIINNKLVIKPCKKTVCKINRKLKRENNYFKKVRSLASYNGYFKRFNITIGECFKVDIDKTYEELKKQYNNYLIMIINGKFYDAINEDGKILHIIQNYKYTKNRSGFPIDSLNDVTDRLSLYHINYLVFNNGIEYKIDFDDNSYESFLNKTLEEENLKEKRKMLFDELNKAIKYHGDQYEQIYEYLKSINVNQYLNVVNK